MAESSFIEGVGLLLFSRDASGTLQLFVVEELVSKPEYGKVAGMLSFPLETFEEGDGDDMGTIRRLLAEEVGIPMENIEGLTVAPGFLQPIPQRQDVHIVYGYGLFTGDIGAVFVPGDTDIRFHGWLSIDQLLSQNVRLEVAPILKDFVQNHLDNFVRDLQTVT